MQLKTLLFGMGETFRALLQRRVRQRGRTLERGAVGFGPRVWLAPKMAS
jgi:hypothetical protein